jgi:hypothetical protein
MPKTDDGGPAFPRPGYYPDGSNNDNLEVRERMDLHTQPQPGMTLRDYFAAQALAGILAHTPAGDYEAIVAVMGPLIELTPGVKSIATAAYCLADAMLAARAKK